MKNVKLIPILQLCAAKPIEFDGEQFLAFQDQPSSSGQSSYPSISHQSDARGHDHSDTRGLDQSLHPSKRARSLHPSKRAGVEPGELKS